MTALTILLRTVSESNSRDHWAKKAKRVAEHRGFARQLCIQQLRALDCGTAMLQWAGIDGAELEAAARVNYQLFFLRPGCVVTLTRRSPRALDDDNLRGALKACRDGVADALGVNDRDPRVTWEYRQERAKTYSVRIAITPTSKGDAPMAAAKKAAKRTTKSVKKAPAKTAKRAGRAKKK